MDLPQGIEVVDVAPEPVKASHEPLATVARALDAPRGMPPLAELGGRVPLACRIGGRAGYEPQSRLTCVLNRHYVRPELRAVLEDVGDALRLPARIPPATGCS